MNLFWKTRKVIFQGCSFLGCYSKWCSLFIVTFCCCYCLFAKLCPTLLLPHGPWPARVLCPWDFPGKNMGMGCHFLLQGIFPTQGLNSGLLHWQVTSSTLSHHIKISSILTNSYLKQPTFTQCRLSINREKIINFYWRWVKEIHVKE